MGQALKRTPRIFFFLSKLFSHLWLSSETENEGGYTFDFQALVFMSNKGQEMEIGIKTGAGVGRGERRQRDRETEETGNS